ncbi:receptor homology region, transmembrane domain- and RING domain-containing protein 2-like isoform X2 [Panicum virgatum]|uniref:receptor homology region, transmembrane domain- and RING domain-containing protein 2-like isoform X2 n=1 Tax=Panicum virgatum TaxID=38727 RepID=UPI0019D67312|nr:receptor homology region, transmembrane domain- and RING domain-containing protein 2-like isoform X2 [Panicum virgatum]
MTCPRRWRSFPLCFFLVIFVIAQLGACNVVLMANNTTLSFDDVEATFTPVVKGSGVNGALYAAEPLDACSPLRTKAVKGSVSPFALVIRGGCQFDEKVRNAQNAGFKAAIVYDNEDNGVLVSMAGSSSEVDIYAVFISKASGEVLKKYSATCFFVRRHQIRQDRARIPRAREFHGMSSQLVKAMPSLIFTKVQEDNCTSSTCAICLEDYTVGEKLRVLPCRHKFHAACVDLWLTSWRTFCPVCKRDAKAGTSNPPVSEATPLLSSAIRLPAESIALASFRSTVAAYPPRPISRHPSSQSISRDYSISGSSIPRTPNLNRSYANSPPICTSASNADLANMSSSWCRTSHLASAHSLCGGHLSPSINFSYISPHVSYSGYGSPSRYIGSSQVPHGSPSYYTGSSGQRHPYLRHCTLSGPSLFTMLPPSPQQNQLQHGGDSETSLSAAASTQSFRQLYLQHCPDSDTSSQSLPGC